MALALMTIACGLFYASSKYFPWAEVAFLRQNRLVTLGMASAVAFFSLYLFTQQYDVATGITIWATALMCILSMMVLSLKLNRRWIWGWGMVLVLFIVLDFV